MSLYNGNMSQNFNTIITYRWVRNLVVDIAGGREAEGV